MIYSETLKYDSKQFIVKSNKTHIILSARFIKIIKYKIYYNKVLVFYRYNSKIYQKFITGDYFNEKCGTPRYLCSFILKYKPILAYTDLRCLSSRYLKRYYPEDLNIF